MTSRKALNPNAAFAQSLAVVLFIGILFVARDVLIPLTLGILLAFLLSPVVNRLQRLGLSNITAVIVTAGVVFSGLGLFLILLWNGFANLSAELPKYRREVVTKISSLRQLTSGFGGQLSSLAADVTKAIDGNAGPASLPGSENVENSEVSDSAAGSASVDESKDEPLVNDGSGPKQPLYVVESPSKAVDFGSWAGGLAAVLGPIGTAGLVTVFALFALIYRDDLRDRFTSVVARSNYVITSEALEEASRRVSRYLMAQLLLNVSYGCVFAMGLMVVGFAFTPDRVFPYVILLGTIAGVVRFIPYVGPFIGAGLPLLLSIALFPGYAVFIAVLTLIVLMELLSNNVVEPWLYGSRTGVSAVAIILSAVFWGWLWGPIGLLLATPLTVCVVVFGTYVPRFQFLAKLLSEKVYLKRSVRGYQRLLSGDTHKLSEYLQSELEASSPNVVLEKIVVPVIKNVLSDRDALGVNDAVMFDRLWTSMLKVDLLAEATKPAENEVSNSASSPLQTKDKDDSTASAAAIVAVPEQLPLGIAIASRHRGEEILLNSIAYSLRDSLRLELFDNDDLPDRESQDIVSQAPAVIVIGVIPPGGTHQARYWCRALREAGYKGLIIVACIGRFKNFDRLFVDFRKSGANWFTTTVEQTGRKLKSIADRSAGLLRKYSDIA